MGENPSIADLIEQVELIDKHGDAWRAYIEWRPVADVSEYDFENVYAGKDLSEEAWLEQ